MGARPIQRLIQDKIRRPLANALISEELTNGGHVTIDVDQERKVQLIFDSDDTLRRARSPKRVMAELG